MRELTLPADFPVRVGQGYGPDWTLVVSPAPSWLVGWLGPKILYKMGPYASIWAHTLRIRSHIGYKGSCVPKIGLGHHNISNISWTLVQNSFFPKNVKKYNFNSSRARGPKILVRPAPTF